MIDPVAKKPRLPGMEPDSIPEVDQACQNFHDAAATFSKAGNVRKERHTTLMDLFKKHKLKSYEYEDYIFEIDHSEKDKIKVKKKEAE